MCRCAGNQVVPKCADCDGPVESWCYAHLEVLGRSFDIALEPIQLIRPSGSKILASSLRLQRPTSSLRLPTNSATKLNTWVSELGFE